MPGITEARLREIVREEIAAASQIKVVVDTDLLQRYARTSGGAAFEKASQVIAPHAIRATAHGFEAVAPERLRSRSVRVGGFNHGVTLSVLCRSEEPESPMNFEVQLPFDAARRFAGQILDAVERGLT